MATSLALIFLASSIGVLTPSRSNVVAFDAVKWKALVEGNRQRILEADTVEAFEGEIQKLIAELKISHMVFFHHSLLKIPPNYAIGATFQPNAVNGTDHWMFQDVHEGGPAELSGMHAHAGSRKSKP